MKATEQYFTVVLFIVLHKVINFESVDKILKCDHSNESCHYIIMKCSLLLSGTVCFSMDVFQNETNWYLLFQFLGCSGNQNCVISLFPSNQSVGNYIILLPTQGHSKFQLTSMGVSFMVLNSLEV